MVRPTGIILMFGIIFLSQMVKTWQSMSVKVREVTEPIPWGEGPHWDSRVQALYGVDVFEQRIFKYDPATGLSISQKLDEAVGFIVPVEGVLDQFVVGLGNKFVVVQWDGKDKSPAKVVKELAEVDKDAPVHLRINDGKVDPRGRVFAGSIPSDHTKPATNIASVYRLEGAKITTVEQGITVANGLSWDLKEKAFYYTDSMEYKIRRYDYDVDTGDISNLRYIFDVKENGLEGAPDGHTIDTDGNLWIALCFGSCVIQVDPRTGKVLRKVPIPSEQVTSATFGGPNLDILYVTTGATNLKPQNFDNISVLEYPAGCVFEVTGLGAKGHPNRNFKL